MKTLIQKATIIDPTSAFHRQTVDVLIEDGIIQSIAPQIEVAPNVLRVEREQLHLSRGWFDSSVSFGEPGFEARETLENGLRVAALSGFCSVVLQPNTEPVNDRADAIAWVKSKAANTAVDLYPMGALTKNAKGQELAELFEMQKAGAVGFGDYQNDISNAQLLKLALQYTQDFNGLVVVFSMEPNLRGKGVVNEGIPATRLGLKGMAALAEEIQIARNLSLLEYTGGRLHLATVSSAGSAALIQQAKAKGMKVSCSVSVAHLVLNDEVLDGFDTRFKLLPPLRSEADRQALVKAVLDGTIDAITADHQPIETEGKKLEFDLAAYGSIGLESAFGALNKVLPLEIVIDKLTSGAQIFGVDVPAINIGEKAHFTLFNPEIEWTFTEADIRSKSKNAALLGQKLKGKAYGIFNRNQLVVHE